MVNRKIGVCVYIPYYINATDSSMEFPNECDILSHLNRAYHCFHCIHPTDGEHCSVE